jgi:molybdopterin synthase catalytic subunit
VTEPTVIVALSDWPLDVSGMIRQIVRDDCGAIVTFEGTTRSPSDGRVVRLLDYEAYEERALKQMRAFANEAVERFGLGGVAAAHRTGEVPVGHVSVVVSCVAPHREQAFEGARWLIDRIKADAAIWKKEVFDDGEAWVGVET